MTSHTQLCKNGFISLSQYCGGISTHSSVRCYFSSMRFAGICLCSDLSALQSGWLGHRSTLILFPLQRNFDPSFYNVALFIEIWEYLFMLGSLRFCNSILINVSSGLWLGNCSTLCWYAFFGFSIHVTKHYNQAPQLWSPLVQKSCDLLKCNTARRACSW